MADDRHEIAMAARLDPQDAKAVLCVMERDALDEPGEDFTVRRWTLFVHRILSDVGRRHINISICCPRDAPQRRHDRCRYQCQWRNFR
jgi:hypothetical protein